MVSHALNPYGYTPTSTAVVYNLQEIFAPFAEGLRLRLRIGKCRGPSRSQTGL